MVVNDKQNYLEKLLKIEKHVASIAAGDIIFSPALITQGDTPIVRRGTINVIQGRQGSHKSRLAELLSSMMIREENNLELSLGFERNREDVFTVVYVDTERNKNEEFPASIQRIIRNAGYSTPADIQDFRFTSLKDIERGKRQETLKLFLENIRATTANPLFVVLDVVTDCIGNFNDPVESMLLLDYVGNLTEIYNATFLLVIHENPGGEKARGHLGTEAINKASTVMRIGYKRANGGESPDTLALDFVKTRHSHKIPSIPLKFREETSSLVIHDSVAAISASDRGKAPIAEVRLRLSEYLRTPMEQKQLVDLLCEDFKCSANTIKNRLQEMERTAVDLTSEDSVICKLHIIQNSGKPTVYELVEAVVAA